MYMPDTNGSQKRVTDPLELELELVASCHSGAGKQTQVLYKSSKHS